MTEQYGIMMMNFKELDWELMGLLLFKKRYYNYNNMNKIDLYITWIDAMIVDNDERCTEL